MVFLYSLLLQYSAIKLQFISMSIQNGIIYAVTERELVAIIFTWSSISVGPMSVWTTTLKDIAIYNTFMLHTHIQPNCTEDRIIQHIDPNPDNSHNHPFCSFVTEHCNDTIRLIFDLHLFHFILLDICVRIKGVNIESWLKCVYKASLNLTFDLSPLT